jgi:CHAT domain-containing protein/tetratricopeptide (TPR) repeat protein
MAEARELLAAERFTEAQTRIASIVAAAPATDPHLAHARLQALELLIDSAIAQHTLVADAVPAWIDEARTLTRREYGDNARGLAWLSAVEATRFVLHAKEEPAAAATDRAQAKALYEHSLDLLQHGTGSIAPADQAYVYQVLSQRAAGQGDIARAHELENFCLAALAHPHSDWERRARAFALVMLATYETETGQGKQGHTSARAAAALAARVSGTNSMLYADIQWRIGQIEFLDGDYAAAREMLTAAVATMRAYPTMRTTLGPAINVLANTLTPLGDYDAARQLYDEALALAHGESEGAPSTELPLILDGYATLEREAGNTQRARDLFARALAAEAAVDGVDNAGAAPILNNLGDLELAANDIDAAGRAYQRGLDLLPAGTGLDFRWALTEGLGMVQLARGQPAAAEQLLTQSIDGLVQGWGDEHIGLAGIRCEKAFAVARQGRDAEAFALALASERTRVGLLEALGARMSEQQSINFKRRLRDCSGVLLALTNKSAKVDDVLDTWQLVARSRGLATRLHAARIAATRAAADAAGRERLNAWEQAAQAYANLLLGNTADGGDLRQARMHLAETERALGDLRAQVGIAPPIQTPVAALFDHLPDGSVLIAFREADGFDLSQQAHDTGFAGRMLYALVHTAGTTRLVALGDAAKIAFLVEHWLALQRDPHSGITAVMHAGAEVRAAIWDKLDVAAAPTRVFVIPDGAVFRVDFAALPDGESFFVERGWRAHELEGERDLDLASSPALRQHLLLLGAPDYGATRADATDSSACATDFSPLPGAGVELAQLAALGATVHAETTLLQGVDATKGALLAAAPGSTILHFATHAVALGAPCSSAASSVRKMMLSPAAGAIASRADVALALAGANRYRDSGDAQGILSSAEIVTLPLQHARWVVLAACDSGLGEVVADEGVFGMRRAFRIAGAATVVMGLWEIDDASSATWMQALYDARLLHGADTPDAVAAAQLKLITALRQQPGAIAHPYYWAGYIAAGDWH